MTDDYCCDSWFCSSCMGLGTARAAVAVARQARYAKSWKERCRWFWRRARGMRANLLSVAIQHRIAVSKVMELQTEVARLQQVLVAAEGSCIDHNGECLICDSWVPHAETCPFHGWQK